MILVWLLFILVVGGLLSWLSGSISSAAPKWIALLGVLTCLFICHQLWHEQSVPSLEPGQLWIIEYKSNWIPDWNINFHLGLDGLSLTMLLLTYLIGVLAILCSWTEIKEKTRFFYFNLLWVLAGITGVFVALDLFLFYFFWEVMLVPMYFLIGIWGSEKRIYASYKFFIFTQASGLLMLASIIAIYLYFNGTSFSYEQLIGVENQLSFALPIMLGFFIAFVVKLPLFPFHTWLPDAHSEAPTAGSVVLAGLMLKTGAYGLLRFVLPLFPNTLASVSNWAIILGVISILYGALQAFGQTDLKRLVAYTSVSHMGFIILGVFAFSEIALQGVILQMISHGISTAALFILAGMLKERLHTRDINQMGGFWSTAPQMGSFALVFAMAACGLPALGNFVAEFLILLGAFDKHPIATAFASLGLILSAIYSVRIMQKIFFGDQKNETHTVKDISIREQLILGVLTLAIIVLGLFPQPVIDLLKPISERLTTNSAIIPKTNELKHEHYANN